MSEYCISIALARHYSQEDMCIIGKEEKILTSSFNATSGYTRYVNENYGMLTTLR